MQTSAITSPTELLTTYLGQFKNGPVLQFQEGGSPTLEDTSCVCCARAIKKGDLSYDKDFLGLSFGDAPSLRAYAKGGGLFCWHCRLAMGYEPATVQFSYAAIGVDPQNPKKMVAYKVFGAEDFLAAIYNPPAPPFVLVRKERKKQHMIWKGRVNLQDPREEDLIFFSAGENTFSCHPRHVLSLASKEQELLCAVKESVRGKKKVAELKYLFSIRGWLKKGFVSTFVPADFRSPVFQINDEALQERLSAFQQAVLDLSPGDRILLAMLWTTAILKKSKDYVGLVGALKPTPVDIKSILEGTVKAEPEREAE